jgi:hypothetical protein
MCIDSQTHGQLVHLPLTTTLDNAHHIDFKTFFSLRPPMPPSHFGGGFRASAYARSNSPDDVPTGIGISGIRSSIPLPSLARAFLFFRNG